MFYLNLLLILPTLTSVIRCYYCVGNNLVERDSSFDACARYETTCSQVSELCNSKASPDSTVVHHAPVDKSFVLLRAAEVGKVFPYNNMYLCNLLKNE